MSSSNRGTSSDSLAALFSQKANTTRETERWVSKSNLMAYRRCPWAFWMIDSGQLDPDVVLDQVPALQVFIDEGQDFEAGVRADAVAIPGDELPTLSEYGASVIFGVPIVQNDVLGIFGQPDAVSVESGVLAPVEVKSHRKRTAADEIELCFYWDLLEPWRISSHSDNSRSRPGGTRILTVEPLPHGYLLLPDGDGGHRREMVWLTEKRFTEMRELVEGVRNARQHPPAPRICDCMVCSRIFRERIEERARARSDLTLIWGIKRKRALVLETAGISTVEALRTADPDEIVTALRAAKTGVPSRNEVEGWIHHAIALTSGEPVVFGQALFDHSAYIALDLEYDSDPRCRAVYLAGVIVVTESSREERSFWADNGDEGRLLDQLAGLLANHPELPVITWNGKSADGVQLGKACAAADRNDLWTEFQARHLDLYQCLRESVRFPVTGFDQKSLARYLGVKPGGRVVDGLDTVELWRRYRKTNETPAARTIRDDLTRYNLRDVTTLVDLAGKTRELHRAAGRPR